MSEPPDDRPTTPSPTWLRVCIGLSLAAMSWQTIWFALCIVTRDALGAGLAFAMSLCVSAPLILLVGLVPATIWTLLVPRASRRPLLGALLGLLVVGGEVAAISTGLVRLSAC
jgi:hypothetical protein